LKEADKAAGWLELSIAGLVFMMTSEMVKYFRGCKSEQALGLCKCLGEYIYILLAHKAGLLGY